MVISSERPSLTTLCPLSLLYCSSWHSPSLTLCSYHFCWLSTYTHTPPLPSPYPHPPPHPHIEYKLPVGRHWICVQWGFFSTTICLAPTLFTWNSCNHKVLEGTCKSIIRHLPFYRWGNPESLSDFPKVAQLVGAKPQSKHWIPLGPHQVMVLLLHVALSFQG